MKYIIAIILFKMAYTNKKRRIQYLCLILLLFLSSFIISTFYQTVYGKKIYAAKNSNETKMTITPIKNKKREKFSNGKYVISYEAQAEIDMRARVVFVDFYDGLFSSWDYNYNPVYDNVSPVDLSIFIGSMAKDWKKYPVKHERRAMIVYGDLKNWESENLHIIPATKNIYAGLKTIRKGDIVSLKGYLVNWQGTEKYNYLKFQTALSFVTESKQKLGGRFTWKCMHFFVTELSARGYIYK